MRRISLLIILLLFPCLLFSAQKAKTKLQQAFQKSALETFTVFNDELTVRKIKQPKPQVQKKQPAFIVVIDAGHGGKDPGALGRKGTREKDIVLKIAKILRYKLNDLPNVRAYMTRDNDYFVPLRKRLSIAREKKADLFIAIHADAYFDHAAKGASVYALSEHGATSEAARWLAMRDNHSELDGVELGSLSDRDPVLRSVLVDLSQTSTINDSLRLGNLVLDALDEISPLHHANVERAPFVVLKSPDIPSILVETGFITSPGEEKRLSSAWYQVQVAEALMEGVRRYIR